MSNIRSFRIFSSEIMKAAAKVDDADIRALLAERKGEEYLQGGKLPSNTAEEAQYVRKVANFRGASMVASDNYDLKAQTKKNNKYQTGRDYAATGMKGGLTALGLLGATNAMRGRFSSPSTNREIRRAAGTARKAFAGGAAIAVGDKAYRHDELPGQHKTAMVAPNPGSAFRSASTALSNAAKSGSFKSSVVHKTGKPPRVIQLGQKFRQP